MNNKIVHVYTDGSFDIARNIAKWAFVATQNETVLHKDTGIIDCPVKIEGRQISGECQGIIEGIKWCKNNGYKCSLKYDYTGLFFWVADMFGGKPWSTNKQYTKDYREFCLAHREIIVDFVKIKAHSGDRFNTLVDSMMH